MADPLRQQLRQAYDLIKARRKAEARAVLEEVLTANPRLTDGYYLYSLAVSTPAEAREALEIALEINPEHARSRRALEQLDRRYPLPTRELSRAAAPAVGSAIAPLDASVAVAPLRAQAFAPQDDDGDDEPPDALFSPAGDSDEEEEAGPPSAAHIGLTIAGRSMNLPVGPLVAIGIGVVLIVMAVMIIVIAA